MLEVSLASSPWGCNSSVAGDPVEVGQSITSGSRSVGISCDFRSFLSSPDLEFREGQ